MRVPPTQAAIRVIQEEHDLLHAVVHGMLHLVRDINKGGAAPDLRVFRAMVYYIREYPEKVHHPKEDHFLFDLVRKRTDEVNAAIAELESQHGKGDALVAQLEHALNRYELEGQPAFKPFSDMVERYAAFYINHMRLEEEAILPAALKSLTKEDWSAINEAFSSNNDPLVGGDHKLELQKLFTRIVQITPPPIGVGPAV